MNRCIWVEPSTSLANRSDDFELTYGGLLIGWTLPAGSKVRFGGRGLLGFGTATLGDAVTVRDSEVLDHSHGAVRSAGRLRVRRTAGAGARRRDTSAWMPPAGYRFAGMDDFLDDRLNGATGSLAVQIGW